ncbi:MAG: hypothetical protein D8B54_05115 [Catonella sp.]|nr:MAG: hypothetical protein D8B54_05115 [Catonella sp.]
MHPFVNTITKALEPYHLEATLSPFLTEFRSEDCLISVSLTDREVSVNGEIYLDQVPGAYAKLVFGSHAPYSDSQSVINYVLRQLNYLPERG